MIRVEESKQKTEFVVINRADGIENSRIDLINRRVNKRHIKFTVSINA